MSKVTFTKRGTISDLISLVKKSQPKKKNTITVSGSGGGGGGGGGAGGGGSVAAAAPPIDKKYMQLPKQFGQQNSDLKDTQKLEMLPYEKGAAFTSRFYIYKNKTKVRCKDAEAYYHDAHFYVQRAMLRALKLHFLVQSGDKPTIVVFETIGDKPTMATLESKTTYYNLGLDSEDVGAFDIGVEEKRSWVISGNTMLMKELLPQGTTIVPQARGSTSGQAIVGLNDAEFNDVLAKQKQRSVKNLGFMPVEVVESSTCSLNMMTVHQVFVKEHTPAMKAANAVIFAGIVCEEYQEYGIFAYANGFDVRVFVPQESHKKALEEALRSHANPAISKFGWKYAHDVRSDWGANLVVNEDHALLSKENVQKLKVDETKETLVLVETLRPLSMQKMVELCGKLSLRLLSARSSRTAYCAEAKEKAKDRVIKSNGEAIATITLWANVQAEADEDGASAAQ